MFERLCLIGCLLAALLGGLVGLSYASDLSHQTRIDRGWSLPYDEARINALCERDMRGEIQLSEWQLRKLRDYHRTGRMDW